MQEKETQKAPDGAFDPARASRLARLVGRDGWKNFDGIAYAVLGEGYEKRGLLRTVKHRDHTRTFELTRLGRAAILAAKADRGTP